MYKHNHDLYIIRPDGEVPFDNDDSPEFHAKRDGIIAHLVNQGHELEVFAAPGKLHKHLRIKNWQQPRIGS